MGRQLRRAAGAAGGRARHQGGEAIDRRRRAPARAAISVGGAQQGACFRRLARHVDSPLDLRRGADPSQAAPNPTRLARGRRRSSASWPASRAGGGRRRATSRLRRRVVAGGVAADAARQEARRREGFLERTQRPPRRVGLGASRRRRRAGARRRLSAAGAARGSGRCQAPARRGYRAAPSWLHVGRKVLTETVGPAMGRMAMLLGTVVGMAHTCTGRSRCVPGAGRRGVTLSE
mmetsp:Transcript_1941/g.6101  ORF Transcript_1941/g.6101 Transcript_1941/m.6101 type:complete len:234 (+) Transcript_1941:641-1342(+)